MLQNCAFQFLGIPANLKPEFRSWSSSCFWVVLSHFVWTNSETPWTVPSRNKWSQRYRKLAYVHWSLWNFLQTWPYFWICNMNSPTQMHSYCWATASTSGPLSHTDRQATMQLGFQLSFLDIPGSTSTLYNTQTSSGRIIYHKRTYHCRQVLTYPFSPQLLKLPIELVIGMKGAGNRPFFFSSETARERRTHHLHKKTHMGYHPAWASLQRENERGNREDSI